MLEVARELLGLRLVRRLGRGRRLSGRIVEVEAYDGGSDRACHASRGRTPRNDPMFGPPGHAYIYLIYGMHLCLNVVTGPVGYPAAILIRAIEPLEGLRFMDAGRAAPRRIASGPGRLTRALRIGMSLNRADLLGPGPLCLEAGDPGEWPAPRRRIVSGPRIGVESAGEPWAGRPWRFGLRGEAALSRPFPGGVGKRAIRLGRGLGRR